MIHIFLRNYAARHRHPINVWLHVIGLPVTFGVPPLLLLKGYYWWALAAFIVGYALQFVGHAVEGNDPGEVILVKKVLGRPYVDVVQRANESTEEG